MTSTDRDARAPRADERRLLSSVAISSLGTWSYNVGIAVFAYQETQSAAWVAAATVGRYVPALLITAVGSRWADRRPRREVAAIADASCALLMLVLTVLAAVHGPLVAAIAVAALSSGISRVQSSATLAMTSDIVPESRLASTAALLSTTDAVATAAGPALASLVLAFASPAALFGLNGVSFATSALLILGITARSGRGSIEAADPQGPDDVASQTLRLVWPLLASRSLVAFVYGADVVLLAIIATAQLRQGTAGYGWLLAGAGAGGLLAAAWLRSRGRDRATWVAVPLGLATYALPLLAFVAAPLLGEALLVQGLRGVGLVLASTAVLAGLQTSVPTAVAGRVFGMSHVALLLGTSAGALAAPVLLDRAGLTTTLVVVALVPTLLGLALLPWLRRFDAHRSEVVAALEPQVHVLRGLDLFHEASRATLYAVAASCRPVEYAVGDTVLRQGDVSEDLVVVVTGSVDVHVDDGVTTSLVRTMHAPTYVGEIGLVHNRPRTATVVAAGPVSAWLVPAETFLSAAANAGLSGALDEGIRVRLGTRQHQPSS